MQLRAAFAGRADEDDRESLVVGHRDERRFAEARDAFDSDLLRVYGLVGLEVVEAARSAPRPGAQRSPVIRMPKLPLVDEADDALGETGAVIGLDAAGVDRRVSPSVGDQLFRRRRIGRRHRCGACGSRFRTATRTETARRWRWG